MKKTMTMNKYLIVAVIAIGLVVGWKLIPFQNKPQQDQGKDTMSLSASLVTSEEVDQLILDKDPFILDVHTPEQTHIPGTDAFIPYNKISSQINSLPQDKNTPILVYCRSGSMSAEASQELIELGYTEVYDLEGGINEYKNTHETLSVTPETKELGTVIYGDIAKAEFTLTNFTPNPVKVTRVSTSCGCTTAELDTEELDAYESTTVRVSFDPAFHKDDTDLGELTRTVFIETDHPDFPKLSTDITANVIKE